MLGNIPHEVEFHCTFSGLSGGIPPAFSTYSKADHLRLKYGRDVVIKKEGSQQIVKDPTKRNYIHVVPGTPGTEYGAGLFLK